MKALFAILFILSSSYSSAQTLVAKTEAGLSFCITCSNNASFLPLSSSDMRQLDAVMKKEQAVTKEAPKKVFIGPIDETVKFDLAAMPQKPTAQELLNQSQRLTPLDENKHLPVLYKPRKLKYVYLLDTNDRAVTLGLNSNAKLQDPSVASSRDSSTSYYSKKNPKLLGIKYQKKFFGIK